MRISGPISSLGLLVPQAPLLQVLYLVLELPDFRIMASKVLTELRETLPQLSTRLTVVTPMHGWRILVLGAHYEIKKMKTLNLAAGSAG